MCEKKGYPSEREARTMLNSYHKHYHGNKRKNFNDKIPRRAYKCPKCGMWHLTSMSDYDEGYKG